MIELYALGSALAVTGLIFFIINNAFATVNFKRRGIIFLITGLVLIIAIIIAHYFDRYIGRTSFTFTYYAFPIAVVFMTTILTTINLAKGKKYNHKFHGYKQQRDNKEEYVYILYKYQDDFLLKQENRYHSGEVIKVDRRVMFHDEMIKKQIKKHKFTAINEIFLGTITVKQKTNVVFYCYVIDLQEISDNHNFVSINKHHMHNIKALDFHKNVILRMLINEKFDINI